MKNQTFISLLILTIFTLIIVVGCGDGSGDAISNPGSINNNTYEQTGSLIIKILWPQSTIEGECTLSSNEANTLIASMPHGTRSVSLRVYERDNTDNLFAGRTYEWDYLEPILVDTIDSLPVVWVIVEVTPYDKNNYPIVDPIKKEIQIIAGLNILGMNLGHECLEVAAHPPYIALSPVIPSRAGVGPPSPELSGETQIVARLYLESPDIPDQPVIVTPTPGVVPRDTADIESQGAWGLENYEVKFTVLSGAGAELIPLGGTDPEAVVTAQDRKSVV